MYKTPARAPKKSSLSREAQGGQPSNKSDGGSRFTDKEDEHRPRDTQGRLIIHVLQG